MNEEEKTITLTRDELREFSLYVKDRAWEEADYDDYQSYADDWFAERLPPEEEEVVEEAAPTQPCAMCNGPTPHTYARTGQPCCLNNLCVQALIKATGG